MIGRLNLDSDYWRHFPQDEELDISNGTASDLNGQITNSFRSVGIRMNQVMSLSFIICSADESKFRDQDHPCIWNEMYASRTDVDTQF